METSKWPRAVSQFLSATGESQTGRAWSIWHAGPAIYSGAAKDAAPTPGGGIRSVPAWCRKNAAELPALLQYAPRAYW